MKKKIVLWFHNNFMVLFWKSPWGAAFANHAWDLYKKTFLYTERCRVFGHMTAAEMYLNEINFFCNKAINDVDFINKVVPNPYPILSELMEKDRVYKDIIVNKEIANKC